MRILIAEDDLTSRNILLAALNQYGHEVLATKNGREAWDALQRPDAPSLAILDWMMPELDGPAVIRRVRNLSNDCPPYIIILTTKGEKTNIVTGLEAGADDYLTKPFDPDELRARIAVGKRMVELQAALAYKVQALQKALHEVQTLRGLIPICAYCKKIRDDKGFWHQVEVYIHDHTEANFTHGICPACTEIQLADLKQDVSGQTQGAENQDTGTPYP